MADTFDAGENEPVPERPAAVLAATDRPVPIEVREIDDDRVPEGMACLGTFLDGTLVARCVVPPGTGAYFAEHGVFAEPRQLVLAAREEEPGLQCELYAIVPAPPEHDDDSAEPWAASVPSYEERVRDGGDEVDELGAGPGSAAILLGSIVRFRRDRKHPDSLPLETIDVLSRIVSGRVVEAIDKALEDLLGP